MQIKTAPCISSARCRMGMTMYNVILVHERSDYCDCSQEDSRHVRYDDWPLTRFSANSVHRPEQAIEQSGERLPYNTGIPRQVCCNLWDIGNVHNDRHDRRDGSDYRYHLMHIVLVRVRRCHGFLNPLAIRLLHGHVSFRGSCCCCIGCGYIICGCYCHCDVRLLSLLSEHVRYMSAAHCSYAQVSQPFSTQARDFDKGFQVVMSLLSE